MNFLNKKFLNQINPLNWFKLKTSGFQKNQADKIDHRQNEGPVVSLNLDHNQPLNQIYRELDQMFDLVFGRATRVFNLPTRVSRSILTGSNRLIGSGAFRSSVSKSDALKETQLSIDVSGFDRSDLSLELDNSRIIITGERRDKLAPSSKNYLATGRFYGRFRRCISLPDHVDVNKIEARLIDGELIISMPWRETAGSCSRRLSID